MSEQNNQSQENPLSQNRLPQKQAPEFSEQQKSEAVEFIINLCHQHLWADEAAINYLFERGFTEDTIKKWKLGSFPHTLADIVREIDCELLKVLKIAWVSQYTGEGICKFRDHYRLIAPIHDTYGKPLAIMGRFIGPEAERVELGIHKYDNSDYKKSKNLFGLNFAKSMIKQKNKALVVEGILDVIKADQHKVECVVGTNGAFFSLEQLALLARYTEKIYFGFDNDEAGNLAVGRALKLTRTGVILSEKRVPKQFKDLDEFLTKKYLINK